MSHKRVRGRTVGEQWPKGAKFPLKDLEKQPPYKSLNINEKLK